MSVCLQRDISAMSLRSVPLGTCVEEVSLLQKRGFYSDSDVTGSPLLFPVSDCPGSRLMRFILKVPEKFLSCCPHGWGPNTSFPAEEKLPHGMMLPPPCHTMRMVCSAARSST
ncbi:hypothetical protein AMECASPLE_039071 [Ameca splendens]|uniref:Uncharacterized protein n=1 Tax=Ameca splendens TaxID=208324 RepID=A0ABV1A4V6_9TELE